MAWWHWVDVALGVAGLGIFAGLAWVLWGPQFTTQFDRLRVGPLRLIALGVLCSLGSALWIGSPSWLGAVPLLPDADLSWRLVAYGLLVPWGVGLIALACMEIRIALDMKRVEHRPLPEHDRGAARVYEDARELAALERDLPRMAAEIRARGEGEVLL